MAEHGQSLPQISKKDKVQLPSTFIQWYVCYVCFVSTAKVQLSNKDMYVSSKYTFTWSIISGDSVDTNTFTAAHHHSHPSVQIQSFKTERQIQIIFTSSHSHHIIILFTSTKPHLYSSHSSSQPPPVIQNHPKSSIIYHNLSIYGDYDNSKCWDDFG